MCVQLNAFLKFDCLITQPFVLKHCYLINCGMCTNGADQRKTTSRQHSLSLCLFTRIEPRKFMKGIQAVIRYSKIRNIRWLSATKTFEMKCWLFGLANFASIKSNRRRIKKAVIGFLTREAFTWGWPVEQNNMGENSNWPPFKVKYGLTILSWLTNERAVVVFRKAPLTELIFVHDNHHKNESGRRPHHTTCIADNKY